MHYKSKPVPYFFLSGTTDLQQNDAEPGGVKRTRTVESAEKQQQGNVQEKSNKGQHSCKTGHLSKQSEIKDRLVLSHFETQNIVVQSFEEA